MGKVDPKNKELDLFDKKISEMSMAERLLVFAYADMQNKNTFLRLFMEIYYSGASAGGKRPR